MRSSRQVHRKRLVLLPVALVLFLCVVIAKIVFTLNEGSPRWLEGWTSFSSPPDVEPAQLAEKNENEEDGAAKTGKRRSIVVPHPPQTASGTQASAQESDAFLAEVRRRAGEDPEAAMLWLKEGADASEGLRGMLEVVAVWASSGSVGALSWLETKAEGIARMETLSSGIDLWSRENPQAAAEWIEGMANDGSKINAAKSLLANWAKSDPASAQAWLARLPADRVKEEASTAFVKAWSATDPEAATLWALGEAEFNGYDSALIASLQKYTETAPAGAENFLRKVAEAYEATDLIRVFVETRARNSPEVAAQWLASLEQGDPLYDPAHGETLLREWSRTDSVAASEWLNQQAPGAQRDAAIKGFTQTMIAFEPEAALAWSGQLSKPEERLNAMEHSLTAWAEKEPTQVRAWLEEAQIEPDLLRHFAKVLEGSGLLTH